MALTPIEWISLIFSVFLIVKCFALILHRRGVLDSVEHLTKNGKLIGLLLLVFAGIVYYCLSTEMSIVQIAAASSFSILLIGATLAYHSKEVLPIARKVLDRGISGMKWIELLVWFMLAVGVMYTLS